MRKLAFVGLLLALSTGCGRGWLPTYWDGAPCNGACGTSLPPAPMHNDIGCTNCPGGTIGATYGSGYSSYPGEIIGSSVIGNGYYDGQVVNERVIGSPTPISPLSGT